MIWDDLATWRPIQYNFNNGGVNRPPLGMVLHIAEGPFEAIWNWSNNPASEVSCFFASAKDGRLEQHVDLDDKAWTQGSGNASWIGVEHEGYAGEALSSAQLENAAQLFAKIVRTWPGVPLLASDSPNMPGLGWHGMGGSSWGGHPGCPGEPIKNQRGAILARAAEINGSTPNPQPPNTGGMLGPFPLPSSDCYAIDDGTKYTHSGARGEPDHTNIKKIQNRLMALGFSLPRYGADGWYGGETTEACKKFQQQSVGLKVDGMTGPDTWNNL